MTSRIEVGNSEKDSMHGIGPRCEEQRVNNVHMRLQQVNGYQPDQDDGNKKNYMTMSVAQNDWGGGGRGSLNRPSACDASRPSPKPPKEIPHGDISFTCKALASGIHSIEA